MENLRRNRFYYYNYFHRPEVREELIDNANINIDYDMINQLTPNQISRYLLCRGKNVSLIRVSRKGYLNIIDYLLRDEIKSYVINCIMALSTGEVIQHIFDNHPIVEFLADDFSAATYSIKHLIDIDNVDLIKRVIDGSRFRTQLMNHIRENNNEILEQI